MASPKFTKTKKDEFLTKFVENKFNVLQTCTELNVSTRSYYHAMDWDDEFKKSVNLYKKISKDIIDTEFIRGIQSDDLHIKAKFFDMIGKYKTFQKMMDIEVEKDEHPNLIFEFKKEDFTDSDEK